MKLAKTLLRVSAYSHGEDHLKVKTVHGGIVTLAAAVLAMFLFIAEAHRCLRVRTVQEMVVDTSIRPTMHVTYDITFPALPCEAIRLDTGDVGGKFETESMHKAVHDGEVHKWRLDRNGKKIGQAEYIPPKGRDNPFVLTLDVDDFNEIRDGVERHEGCNIFGWLEVQRVAGNIHFAVRPEAIIAIMESDETLQTLFDRHVDLHGAEAVRENMRIVFPLLEFLYSSIIYCLFRKNNNLSTCLFISPFSYVCRMQVQRIF